MSFLNVQRSGDSEVWTLARPDRGNGLGTTLAAELASRLADLEASVDKPGALVITARPIVKGTRRTWVAGGDLKELMELRTPEAGTGYAASLSDFMERLDRLPVPVVIAIDGAAIGGGAELALAGDLRLATRGSVLEFRQLRLGLATGYGGARRLVELVGLSRAQALIYGCQAVSAEDALRIGLVHRVVDDDQAMAAALVEVTTALAALPRAAVAAQKRMLWHATHTHPGATRAAELDEFGRLWGNPAHAASLQAFAERKG